ncbi:unnamed protein product [Peronospora belbahrii]|uniref:Uncharacterized protein n=1 Tax=Peronospora belbahrii TaxID=622444 RepID=A0AAU9L7C7_9STRA|nr:unnamed protein product [Peronospora belbahrii]CAH0522019.1 unnamed protein product [Peronospora belbahrii]
MPAEPETAGKGDQNDGQSSQSVEAATEQVARLAVAAFDDEEEEEEDNLANLPKNVLLRVDALRKLQEAQAEVEEEFEKERKALELKYEKLYQPFYQQRAEIVSGAKEVEAVTAAAAELEQVEDEENVKGVPGFWLRAFMNHSALAELIQERDLPTFEYLMDVRSVSHEENNGFKLTFEFAENPFFSNKTLIKEYDVGDVSELGEAVLRNIKGTVIEWKEGKNLCEVTKKVKQRAKGGKGASRVVSRTEPCESFFQFFTPVEMPSEEDDEDSEMIIRQMSGDFEIGFTIHESIIPQALLWFTGEAVEDDDSDYYPEEDEDYEEESLSGDEAPKPRRGKKKFPALESGANSTEKPPECNNQ